ncbi:response regulator transcription factor, partial [bacterium]|nr:response regulator transcription factor [bacterium]
PDLAIIDISLPGMSGLDLIKHVHHQLTSVKILVLSRHDESLYAERAIRAGARGYLMKSEPSEKIVKALRRIDTGAIYISPTINERLLQGIASGHQAFNDSPLEVLSDRELEVFEMTGRGIGTRDIAERLNLSVKTIESYRARVKTKLNLANASELMQHAVQWVESESLESRS